eukprot:NODE_8229_length_527_cov_3.236402_g7174_i0.p4 GENE.NODE_8229_length_527_cov_3.236402_g7174_i0~~NODE_8229_length_527_cov_3.236402_g7174_i0.p4  ORF type:complete len:73 (-),score=7.64 NODE_8229_length_527_cov_3.236402_g7174_i0:1-219(-)
MSGTELVSRIIELLPVRRSAGFGFFLKENLVGNKISGHRNEWVACHLALLSMLNGVHMLAALRSTGGTSDSQ